MLDITLLTFIQIFMITFDIINIFVELSRTARLISRIESPER